MKDKPKTAPPVFCSALLACPFCGGDAHLHVKQLRHLHVKQLRVCGENLYWYVCGTKDCVLGFSLGEWTEELARAKWNRRQANDKLTAAGPKPKCL